MYRHWSGCPTGSASSHLISSRRGGKHALQHAPRTAISQLKLSPIFLSRHGVHTGASTLTCLTPSTTFNLNVCFLFFYDVARSVMSDFSSIAWLLRLFHNIRSVREPPEHLQHCVSRSSVERVVDRSFHPRLSCVPQWRFTARRVSAPRRRRRRYHDGVSGNLAAVGRPDCSEY